MKWEPKAKMSPHLQVLVIIISVISGFAKYTEHDLLDKTELPACKHDEVWYIIIITVY